MNEFMIVIDECENYKDVWRMWLSYLNIYCYFYLILKLLYGRKV